MADLRSRIEQALGTGYRVERELGGGGMSHVFLAEEVALGRRVVIKVLPPEMAASVNADRFQREIRLVASLQHPNIVALITAGGVDDLLWFTMPFVEGEALRARLTREGELPVGTAVRIWGEMLDALAYAHGRGVVHRDIKPENVLLSGRHALVADFGVARALSSATGEERATMTGLSIGTPAYMSPEQAAGDPGADHRSDIYAAGLVMYEMLTGSGPFADRTPQRLIAAHAMQAPPPIRERRDQVSPALESLVMQCLAKRPADRPQSAEAVLQALAVVPDVTPGTGTTSGTRETGAKFAGTSAVAATVPARRLKRRWLLAAVAVAVIVGGFFGYRQVTRGGGVLGAIPDSARLIVMVLPTIADPADSLLARSAEGTIAGTAANDRRLVMVTQELIPLFASNLGMRKEDINRDSLSRWLPDLGVHATLALTIARAGQGYVVSAIGRGLARDTVLLNEQHAAPSAAEVPGVVEELAQRSHRAFSRAFRKIARPEPNGALLRTTAEVARRMRDGWDAQARRDNLAAADHFRAAVRMDSTMPLAWSDLWLSLSGAGVQADERLRAIETAYRHRDRAPFAAWRLEVESNYFYVVQDDARALAAYERAEREFGSPGGNNLALLYVRQRRFEDALRLLERARDTTYLTPWVANTNYISTLIDLGRYDEAAAEVNLLDSISGPNHPLTRQARLQQLRTRRRADSVAILSRGYLDDARTPSARLTASANLRDALLARGELAEVERIQQLRAREFEGVTATRLGADLADARWIRLLRGDSAAAAARVDEAFRVSDWNALPPMDRPYSSAITAYALIGRLVDAHRLSDEWEREIPDVFKPVFQNGVMFARGELALAEGDARRALSQFRAADKGACVACSWPEVARAFDAMGQSDSALVWTEKYLDSRSGRLAANDAVYLAAAYRRAGELLEAKGDLRKAIERYEQFVELWKDADPALQPQVTEVRGRSTRLRSRIG